jgi:hypothetical protein
MDRRSCGRTRRFFSSQNWPRLTLLGRENALKVLHHLTGDANELVERDDLDAVEVAV